MGLRRNTKKKKLKKSSASIEGIEPIISNLAPEKMSVFCFWFTPKFELTLSLLRIIFTSNSQTSLGHPQGSLPQMDQQIIAGKFSYKSRKCEWVKTCHTSPYPNCACFGSHMVTRSEKMKTFIGLKYENFLQKDLVGPCALFSSFISFSCIFFSDRVSLCSPGWPGALYPPASASWVLGLQLGTTMISSLY
jgi:hypothetical protein